MPRRSLFAVLIGAGALALGAITAYADTTPNPPPAGIVVQPISASGGGSGQPANVSTGRAGAGSDQQGTAAEHCGVQAGSGTTGYSAQPSQVGTSGSGTPACSTQSGTSAASNTSAGRQTSARQPAGSTAAGGGASSSSATNNGAGGSGDSLTQGASDLVVQRGTAWSGWLFLLLLLAILFLLLGFALGRRRRAATHAA